MRRVVLSLAFALIAAGAASFSVVPAAVPRQAGAGNVFVLPATDGYGVADCLAENRECGRIVANAWCEAKGFVRAASYRVASASDVTGSVGVARAEPVRDLPVIITCAD
jgi:hypothetical protein